MAKKSLIYKNIYIYKNKIKIKKKINIFSDFLKIKIKKKKLLVRFKKRCYISGSPRSYYNNFNLNRNLIRKIGSFGYIIGLEKSSW